MNKNKITSIILATTMLLETVPVVNAYDDVDLNDTSISIENIENEEENYLDKDSTNPIDATDATQNNDIDNSNNTNSDSLEEPDFDINDFIDNSNINNNELGGVVDSDYMREEVEDGVVQDEAYDDMFVDKEEIDISIANDNTIENSGQAKSNVLEITLADGEYVPDLTNNPNGYKTIVVKTTGNKKLVSTDYDRLRTSKIPNIDLSQAISDSIPASAFKNATHLKTFKFPKEFNTIQGASIGDSAFWGCSNLTGNLIIPDSITHIGYAAFYNCRGLNGNLIIPNSVTSIGDFAFYNCRGLNGNLIIPDSITSIGNFAFYSCMGLNGNLIIPDSITSIGDSAFEGCLGFTGNLIIPDSITSIGNYVFYDCRGLNGNLIIPDSITSIGDSAFENCNNINKIIFAINESFISSNYRKNIFDSLDSSKTVIEIPFNFDTSNTWLDSLSPNNNGKPVIQAGRTSPSGDRNFSVSLYIPTPYSEENITVLKDGEAYDLPTKTSDAKYLFDEEGSYNITLTTDLGSVSNIDFEVAASINKPTIEYKNNLVCIVDNGNNLGLTTDRIEYRINGGEWRVYSGSFRVPDELVNGIDNIKVEARVVVGAEVSKVTEYSLTIPKAQITVSDVEITEGDKFNEYDIISAIDIDGTDISDRVTVVSSDIKLDTPGEYKVVYRVEASNGYFTEKEIKVTVLKKKLPPIIKVEDIIVEKDSEFNPLDFVTVTDADGNLIDKANVEIIENTVNVSVPGIYTITYRIIDDNGLTSTETITVTVKESIVSNGSEGNENNDSNKNNVNTENNNNINDKNNNISKIPNAGGFTSLIYLSSLITIAGSYSLLRKRKND